MLVFAGGKARREAVPKYRLRALAVVLLGTALSANPY